MRVPGGAPPRLPLGLEREYFRRLRARVDAAHRLAMARLLPELARLADDGEPDPEDDDARMDARARARPRKRLSDPEAEAARRAVLALENAFGTALAADREADDLDRLGGHVSRHAREQTDRQMKRLLKVGELPDFNWRRRETRALVQAWSRDNVALIRTIDARYFADLEKRVIGAVRKGMSTRELAAVLQERYAVSKARAHLIARDQVAKLNGQITEHRQRGLGIRRYQWNTSGDERVRDAHRALDGEVFDWDDPPGEGHPGRAVNCRCVAVPILDGDADEVELVAANQRDRRREAAAGQDRPRPRSRRRA